MAIPSADNDYKSDPSTRLNPATWDAVLGSVASRLRALEAKRVEVQGVIDELRQFGLARIDAELAPKIAETQAALDQLEEDMAAAQAIVDSILASTLPATQVNETASRVFVTPAQRAEIGTLRTDLGALTTVVGGKALADLSNATGPRGKLTPAPVNTSPNLFLENGRRLFSSTAPNTPASGNPWLIECIVDDTGADQAIQIAHDYTRFDQDRALFPSYVRFLRNTAWTPWAPFHFENAHQKRLDLSGKQTLEIAVPSWAKVCRVHGYSYLPHNSYAAIRVSGNGSGFLTSAGSYGSGMHTMNVQGSTTSVVTESNSNSAWLLGQPAIAHPSLIPPVMFDAEISLDRGSNLADMTAFGFHARVLSYTDGTGYRISTQGGFITRGSLNALRIMAIQLLTVSRDGTGAAFPNGTFGAGRVAVEFS